MAGSLKKVGIGVEDCVFEDDELYPASTWERQGSLGILTGLTKLPNLLISHQTVVNAKYYGALTDVSIQAAIDHVGTDERIIYLEPGTWVLSTAITGTANIYFQFAPGAYLQPAAGITFTAYSPAHILASPRQQIVDITNNSTDPLLFTTGGTAWSEWWGENTTPGTTDNTTPIACMFASGASRMGLPPGNVRVDSQLTLDASGVSVFGYGRSASSAVFGTFLDLRYAAGHAIIIGSGTQRIDIEFKDMHIYQGNGGDYYCFESVHVRGLFFRNITFSGVYGFLKAGRVGEPSLYIAFDNIEGNMRETGTPEHEHFMDAVNVTGMLFFTGHGHIEGYSTWPTTSRFLNFGDSSAVPDGIQIGSWTIRQFGILFNFLNGVGNFFSTGTLGDFCDFGFYADSDTGPVVGINITGGRFAGGPSSTGNSNGIVIFQTTEAVNSIQITGNLIRDFGRYGIWINGTLDAEIVGNKIHNVGQQTDDTYDGIRVGTSVTGNIIGNLIFSDETNVHRYGVMIDSAEDDLIITGNKSIGHGTLGIGNNERGSAVDRIIRDNTGQGVLGKYILGPWTVENAAQNVSETDMNFAFAGGSVSAQHFRAIRRGRIIGISGNVNAAITAGNLVMYASINGTASALTITLTDAAQYTKNTNDDGIEFAAGDIISVRYLTDGTYAPATLDLLAFLEIIDD